ncbi:uncharacterized protein LOC128217505 [Mya arenaria]|uniref:uncharacterized protein LOC128217505 n=1 Tax=Mya arenaria TaxID=6604 RepID=UPI0022DEA4A0|nr:uncharacterized protein LOC128217505 [Mya arenaria]
MAGFSFTHQQTKKFMPPSKEWQDKTAKQLNIRMELRLEYGSPKYYNGDTAPKLTSEIRADGNCFFRALSVIITGVESNHMTVREQITQHVEKHSDIYRTFLQSRGGMDTYVRSMRRPREWATDTEIFAAATFLKTIIEVCSIIRTNNGREYQWQTFAPLNDDNPSLPKIYICHKDEHFEPILDIAEVAIDGSQSLRPRISEAEDQKSQRSYKDYDRFRGDHPPPAPPPDPSQRSPSNPFMTSSYRSSYRDPGQVQTQTRALGTNQRSHNNLHF